MSDAGRHTSRQVPVIHPRIQFVALCSAGAAVAIWSSLAVLSFSLREIPALQLAGIALGIGGALSIPWWRRWQLQWPLIVLGCYGLFLYHLLFILALRLAPPVQANLVHYLWPTLIVVLSPVLVPGVRLSKSHVVAAGVGMAGAGFAILSGSQADGSWHVGYLLAFAAAVVWSTYSLLLRRLQSINAPTTGLCCLLSGLLALLAHKLTGGPTVDLTAHQWLVIACLGLGPMGGAFYLWSHALRHGDPRSIGVLANATPVLSTVALTMVLGQPLVPALGVAIVLIVCASAVSLSKPPAVPRSNLPRPTP